MDTVNLLTLHDMEEDSLNHDGSSIGSNESSEEHSIVRNSTKSKMTFHLLLATLMAALGGVLFGYDIGIIGGALLQLRDQFTLGALQQEMVVSLMLLGALIGSIFGGFIIDAFGRRHSLIFNSFVFTIGGLILTCANTFVALIFGRIILGFAISLSAIGECIYISEVSPSNRRGQLVSLNELGITIGILLAYLVSYLFISVDNGWRFMFGISIIPAIIQGCGMVILPSSPRFLVKHGKINEATLVLQKLRGHQDVQHEINGMKAGLSIEDEYSLTDLFKPKGNMRLRMLIGGGLVFLQQASGQTNVVYYTPTILQNVGFESDLAATSATVGIGVVKFMSTLLCFLIVDHIGRRKLLLSGVMCMMLSIFILGITTEVSLHQRTNQNGNTSENITTSPTEPANYSVDTRYITYITTEQIPDTYKDSNKTEINQSVTVKAVSLISLMAFVAAYSFSFGPVTWLLLSEIYPLGIRGRATSLVTSMNWMTNMILSLTFLDLINAVDIGMVFIMYGFVCFIAMFFIYLYIPETTNKSLENISKDLSERNFSHYRRRVTLPVSFRIQNLQLKVNGAGYFSMPSQQC